METYTLHGLRLSSELPFPELTLSEGEPQITLRLAPVGVERPAGVQGESWFLGTPDDTTIVWRNFGALRVRAGEEIRVDPLPDVDPRWLRSVLLGQAFSLVLSQRGLFPLHAATVVFAGRDGQRAVALAGEAGAGKSTLCAALVERGHPFLSDDVTGLEIAEERVLARPGVPRQKLTPQAARALGIDPGELSELAANEAKRARRVPTERQGGAAPLAGIFVLETGPTVEIEPLTGARAFAALTRHHHRADNMLASVGAQEGMTRCAALARRVPVLRLSRPRGLEHLDETAAALERYLQR